MNTFKKSLPFLLLSSVASTAFAFDGWYAGVAYSAIDYKEDVLPALDADLDLAALQFQAGKQFSDHFALELRVGTGITDDGLSIHDDGDKLELNLDLDEYASVYAKGILPFGNAGEFSLYALAGYSYIQATATADLYLDDENLHVHDSESSSDGSFSYGAGASYAPTANLYLFAEYVRLFDKDDVTINGINIGINYGF